MKRYTPLLILPLLLILFACNTAPEPPQTQNPIPSPSILPEPLPTPNVQVIPLLITQKASDSGSMAVYYCRRILCIGQENSGGTLWLEAEVELPKATAVTLHLYQEQKNPALDDIKVSLNDNNQIVGQTSTASDGWLEIPLNLSTPGTTRIRIFTDPVSCSPGNCNLLDKFSTEPYLTLTSTG